MFLPGLSLTKSPSKEKSESNSTGNNFSHRFLPPESPSKRASTPKICSTIEDIKSVYKSIGLLELFHDDTPRAKELLSRPKKDILCKYFSIGKCNFEDGKCHYSHSSTAKSDTVCKFFIEGRCKDGKECRHLHVTQDTYTEFLPIKNQKKEEGAKSVKLTKAALMDSRLWQNAGNVAVAKAFISAYTDPEEYQKDPAKFEKVLENEGEEIEGWDSIWGEIPEPEDGGIAEKKSSDEEKKIKQCIKNWANTGEFFFSFFSFLLNIPFPAELQIHEDDQVKEEELFTALLGENGRRRSESPARQGLKPNNAAPIDLTELEKKTTGEIFVTKLPVEQQSACVLELVKRREEGFPWVGMRRRRKMEVA